MRQYTKEEIKLKLLMVRATGKFNDQEMKMIEIAATGNGIKLQLQDTQVEALELLQMVKEKVIYKEKGQGGVRLPKQAAEKTSMDNAVVYDNTIADIQHEYEEQNGESQLQENLAEDLQKSNETIEGQPQEILEDRQEMKEESKESSEKEKNSEEEKEQIPEDNPEKRVEATVELEFEEDEDVPTEFVPADRRKEKTISEYGKMYYLTPERVLETLKNMNNGALWESLRRLPNGVKVQQEVEKAYKSCIWYSDLMNPNFLDDKIRANLPEGSVPVEMKGFHQAALLGTYVGYQVEKNGQEIDEKENDNVKSTRIAVLKFPDVVDQIPNEMKHNIIDDLERAIADRIQDLMNTANPYRALMILSPMEQTVDKAMEDYANTLGDSGEDQMVRAYIGFVRENRESEMEEPIKEMNYSIDLSSLNWNDPTCRKNVVALIERLQGEAKDVNLPDFTEEIKMSFSIRTPADLREVDSVCADLAELSNEGIDVEIAFELPKKAAQNQAIDAKLDEIVNKYDNIERTDEPTTLNEAVSRAVTGQTQTMSQDIAKGVMLAGIIGAATELDNELEYEQEMNGLEIPLNPMGGNS